MNSREIALEYKAGTRVKVLCEDSDLYGEYAWTQRVSDTYVLLKTSAGLTEWIDASGSALRKTIDQRPPD